MLPLEIYKYFYRPLLRKLPHGAFNLDEPWKKIKLNVTWQLTRSKQVLPKTCRPLFKPIIKFFCTNNKVEISAPKKRNITSSRKCSSFCLINRKKNNTKRVELIFAFAGCCCNHKEHNIIGVGKTPKEKKYALICM